MARIVLSDQLAESALSAMPEVELNHIYNCLDCCVTYEVKENLLPQLTPATAYIYRLSRELQGPALEMSLRGLRIDKAARGKLISDLEAELDKLHHNLAIFLHQGLDITDFNPNSEKQVKHLLYEVLRLPVQYTRGRDRKVTSNRDALEKLLTCNYYTQPIITHLLAIADLRKRLGTVKTSIDPDGRIRCTIAIASTTTGRFSSYESPFDTGTNMQNWEKQIRRIVCADPGHKLAYIDLKTAESIALGARCWNLFYDAPHPDGSGPMRERAGKYLDAATSTDVHTATARECWPGVPWTGDPRRDRAIAEHTKLYRDHDYRHIAKQMGHSTNLYGTARELGHRFHLPLEVVENFHSVYFKAFPEIRMYHEWSARQLAVHGHDTSLMGRPRYFFGRRDERQTLKEFICFSQQESVCHILSLGILKLWRARICTLHLQVHDALLIQYPEHLEDTIVPQAQTYLATPIHLNHGRSFAIPTSVEVGWNWGPRDKGGKLNPDGMTEYEGHDGRKRSELSLLDRRL